MSDFTRFCAGMLWTSPHPQHVPRNSAAMAIPLLAPHAHIAWRDSETLVLEDPAAPQTRVQVGNAHPGVVRWLRSCDGTQRLDAVLRTSAEYDVHPASARDLLEILEGAGLLTLGAPDRRLATGRDDASALRHDLEALALSGRDANRVLPYREQHRIVLQGGNRVAHALVEVLSASHIGAVTVRGQHVTRRLITLRDIGPFGPTSDDVGLPPSVALKRHIDRRTPARAVVARRSIVILCDAHCDPADEVAYRTAGVPYLRVLTTSRFATIGPLTLPGHTVCWSCMALHRSDVDPDWPHLLAQFDHHRRGLAPVDSGFAMLIASEAASRLLRVIDTEDPSSLVNTAVHIDARDGSVRRRHWRVHPDCPCQWERAAA